MRMIERWFPCTEVSEASGSGWGSGQSEKALFSWFAARPLAQAKAAVLTSLLLWPTDEAEQHRLQALVRGALTERDGNRKELLDELLRDYASGARMLDPFSGRAMIPLESARLNVATTGVDYSPVATLAGQLLAEYPLKDWSAEPNVTFADAPLKLTGEKLVTDVQQMLAEIGRRYAAEMGEFYPPHNSRQPWGYIWAITLPCQECKRRFPFTGSLVLRHPLAKKNDPGQSYRIDVDRAAGTFRAVVHDGPPAGPPTMVSQTKNGKKVKGKIAVCPFCDHVHATPLHTRLAGEGLGRDVLLVAADLDDVVGKSFRTPTATELAAAEAARIALDAEPAFGPDLPATPTETIPVVNTHTIKAIFYGAKTFADLMTPRQTLGFVRLCRIISALGTELRERFHVSPAYAAALCGYAGSVLVRKLKYSTRGAALQPRKDVKSNRVMTGHIFVTEACLAFNHDFFETALGDGPGTWPSLCGDTVVVLRNQVARSSGLPATIVRGSALTLPLRDNSVDAVVTDPPYDSMIPYSDASDLFYVWLKRALYSTNAEFSITSDPNGVQEKAEEAIVTANRLDNGEHRTRQHYDRSLARALSEARRVVRDDGVVTLVFGHGEPEVWHRLLAAITKAGLFLTGSWPAKTEAGGGAGSANIVTTLTMSCRPAPPHRGAGRAADVEAEVRREVQNRVPMWDSAGLAPTDQAMASAGPAMEIVGRYSEILNHLGEAVDPAQYLIIARRAVREAAAIEIDTLPLESFDSRTGFALYWVRLYARSIAAKSESRWEALAADLSSDGLRGILVDVEKGVRLGYASELSVSVTDTASTIDVALAMAKAWKDGLDAVGQVLLAAARDGEDTQLWAALSFLSTRLPEGDPDAIAWTALVRNRRGIKSVARDMGVSRERERQSSVDKARQGSLFELPAAVTKEVV
jgi:adenine-specific DNA methylase